MAAFLVRFILFYAFLIAPWSGFKAMYGRYLRAAAEIVFTKDGGRRILQVEEIPENLSRGLDTRIVLANRDLLDAHGTGPARHLELDARAVGWMPTAMVLALVLSTPVSWKRRCWAAAFGLIAVHGFIMFSLAVYIWNNSPEMALISLSPLAKKITDALQETLITQMGAGFVVPVVFWVLVTPRKQDIVAWRDEMKG